jgi:hypothetical protein
MREASGAKRGELPRTLRERLALLEYGLVPVSPARARAGIRIARRRARTLIGPSFWVGVGSGGVLGGVLLLLALVTPPEQVQQRARHAQAVAEAISRPTQSTLQAAPTSALAAAPTETVFDLSLSRGDGDVALLPLHVVGVESPESGVVLLGRLPAAARLSRGERRHDGTWALRLADLEDLRLTLGEGTPRAFDMTVEVATLKGLPLAKAMARVRVDQPSAPPALPAGVDRSTRPPVVIASGTSVVPKPFHTEVTALAQADETSHRDSPRPALPEGISALGGPTGSAGEAAPPPTEGRTIWWKLPPPVWSPFKDGASSY